MHTVSVPLLCCYHALRLAVSVAPFRCPFALLFMRCLRLWYLLSSRRVSYASLVPPCFYRSLVTSGALPISFSIFAVSTHACYSRSRMGAPRRHPSPMLVARPRATPSSVNSGHKVVSLFFGFVLCPSLPFCLAIRLLFAGARANAEGIAVGKSYLRNAPSVQARAELVSSAVHPRQRACRTHPW